jgi:hypothetical protein
MNTHRIVEPPQAYVRGMASQDVLTYRDVQDVADHTTEVARLKGKCCSSNQ